MNSTDKIRKFARRYGTEGWKALVEHCIDRDRPLDGETLAHLRAIMDSLSDALGDILNDAQTFKPTAEPPFEMLLCETDRIILKPNQLYIFRVDPDCKRCNELAACQPKGKP